MSQPLPAWMTPKSEDETSTPPTTTTTTTTQPLLPTTPFLPFSTLPYGFGSMPMFSQSPVLPTPDKLLEFQRMFMVYQMAAQMQLQAQLMSPQFLSMASKPQTPSLDSLFPTTPSSIGQMSHLNNSTSISSPFHTTTDSALKDGASSESKTSDGKNVKIPRQIKKARKYTRKTSTETPKSTTSKTSFQMPVWGNGDPITSVPSHLQGSSSSSSSSTETSHFYNPYSALQSLQSMAALSQGLTKPKGAEPAKNVAPAPAPPKNAPFSGFSAANLVQPMQPRAGIQAQDQAPAQTHAYGQVSDVTPSRSRAQPQPQTQFYNVPVPMRGMPMTPKNVMTPAGEPQHKAKSEERNERGLTKEQEEYVRAVELRNLSRMSEYKNPSGYAPKRMIPVQVREATIPIDNRPSYYTAVSGISGYNPNLNPNQNPTGEPSKKIAKRAQPVKKEPEPVTIVVQPQTVQPQPVTMKIEALSPETFKQNPEFYTALAQLQATVDPNQTVLSFITKNSSGAGQHQGSHRDVPQKEKENMGVGQMDNDGVGTGIQGQIQADQDQNEKPKNEAARLVGSSQYVNNATIINLLNS